MSISSVTSGTTASYTTNTQQKDVRNAFKQVADAINDNDLPGAQNGFDTLAQLLGNTQQTGQTPTSSSTPSQTSSNGTDFSSLVNQIGSALQSGNLDQAKQALQNLQQTAPSAGRHHHHHGGHGGGSAAASSTSSQSTSGTTSASTDGSGVDLTV
jgi:hypothetical protein